MAKLNSDGSYKTDFGTNGIVITNAGSSTIQKVIVNETNLIAIGDSNVSTSAIIALAKYNNSNLLNTQENQFENKKFNIYPNPVKDKLNIISLSKQNINFIEIIDALGETILRENGNIEKINLENLSNGLYFLKVNSENKTENFKIIKY